MSDEPGAPPPTRPVPALLALAVEPAQQMAQPCHRTVAQRQRRMPAGPRIVARTRHDCFSATMIG
jgi:hypothetical protein